MLLDVGSWAAASRLDALECTLDQLAQQRPREQRLRVCFGTHAKVGLKEHLLADRLLGFQGLVHVRLAQPDVATASKQGSVIDMPYRSAKRRKRGERRMEWDLPKEYAGKVQLTLKFALPPSPLVLSMHKQGKE